ncbi:antitoxin MazE family protein [Paraburkholderia sp. WSM4175]|uniref:antitoxin MazE family protein n=1 Tax=Paraburkholderia sp. WSM4175 TaxID=2991072 RepID=UPI003D1FB7B1
MIERVRNHRNALRAAGLRPVQIWVPDTRRAGFAEECRRQSLRLREDPHEAGTLDFWEAAADREGWE